MANIKKVTIRKSDLPPVTSNNEYYIRFRLISDDRNRRSHWSAIKTLTGNPVFSVPGSSTVADGIVNVVWSDALNYPNYDVFVRNDNNLSPSEYEYHGTSSVHEYSFLQEGTEQIDIIVQIASVEKAISSVLEVYSETILV